MNVEKTPDVTVDAEENAVTPDATPIHNGDASTSEVSSTHSTPEENVDTVSTEDQDQETPESSQVTTESSPEESTNTERSTITPDPEHYPGLVDENIPQAEEVGGNINLQEHTTFTENFIRSAEVYFALRLNKPVLYRHRATCRSHVRFFDGIDDGVYLAKSGIVWSIPIRGRGESLFEVIAVACLGYREDDVKKKNKSYKKSKSAKVNDTHATMVIV